MSDKKEVNLKIIFLQVQDWLKYLKTKKITLAIYLGVGLIFGLTYTLIKKPTYTAVSTFVLEDDGKSSQLGQYSNLASMVGIDIGGKGSNGIFQGDNIMELYRSRSMLVKTLLSKAIFKGKLRPLAEYYLEISPLKDAWGMRLKLPKLNFADTNKLTLLHDSVLTEIAKEINAKNLNVAKPDKKLSIIKVTYSSKDEAFAKNFNDLIVKNVNDFYVQTKTKKAATNVAILQHQSDSIRMSLNIALAAAAVAIDANPNANLARQILRVPSQKRQIDAESNKAILSQLVGNLELAKVTLRQETPLIQIVDRPILPLASTKYPVIKYMLLGGLIFLVLGIGLLLTKRLYKNIMQ